MLAPNRFASRKEIVRMRTTTARESLWLADPDMVGSAPVRDALVFDVAVLGGASPG